MRLFEVTYKGSTRELTHFHYVRLASRSIPPPMGVNSILSGSPHVLRVHMGVRRTRGEPNKIKGNTHPKKITALFRDCREQVAWPDHGVPQDVEELLQLRTAVRQQYTNTAVPMVVHCRYARSVAGCWVGR